MPEDEEALQWFDDGTNIKTPSGGDFFERLTQTLGLGLIDKE